MPNLLFFNAYLPIYKYNTRFIELIIYVTRYEIK